MSATCCCPTVTTFWWIKPSHQHYLYRLERCPRTPYVCVENPRYTCASEPPGIDSRAIVVVHNNQQAWYRYILNRPLDLSRNRINRKTILNKIHILFIMIGEMDHLCLISSARLSLPLGLPSFSFPSTLP